MYRIILILFILIFTLFYLLFFIKNIFCYTIIKEIKDYTNFYIIKKTLNKDHGSAPDINKMTAQAFTFFLAEFNTVSRIMSFTHEIAINPDIQSKLREEIAKMF